MTRMKLSALMLGATALTMPLGMSAYAQTNQQGQNQQGQTQQAQGQQGQQAANQQGQEMGACEKLYRLVDEAAGERILQQFQNAPQVADQNEAESCALIIRDIEATGGISEEAVAEGRGVEFVTETETFRATDTVTETVEIDRRAIVEGEVLVRQPIPEVGIEQGRAEVQVRERPGRIEVDEQPASIEIRQAAANVRVAVPRPTITIEQPAPEIIVTMPAPGLTVQRDQPQIDVVMAEPTVTVTQEDPQVEVNVDARLVDAGMAVPESEQPRVQTRAERVTAEGQAAQEEAEVAVRKVKPSIRFLTAEVQDDVTFNRAQPRITYQSAEPNVEVTFNEEPRVEIRQTGEPTVRLRREGGDQARTGGQQNQQAQAQQGQQRQQGQAQQGQQNQQAQGQQTQQGQQASAQQGQQGGQNFAANVVRAEDAVLRVDRRVQSASRALEQNDFERARADIQRADQQLQLAMRTADEQNRQSLQGLSDQLRLVIVALDEQDMRGAETALYDAETNLQENRDRWGLGEQAALRQPVESTANVVGQGAEQVGEGVAATGATVAAGAGEAEGRLSLEDTNRLLAAEEGYDFGEAQLTNVTAGDLRGMDVHTVRGEEVGEIEQIASSGGRLFAIISHGGFLGIGQDEVAIPLERIAMRGNEVILLGLTEQQLEQMPNYNFNSDQEFSANEPVEIGRFE